MRKTVIAVVLVAVCFFARQAKADSFTLTIPTSPGTQRHLGTGNVSVTYKDSGDNNVTFTQSGTLGPNDALFNIGADVYGPSGVLSSVNQTSGIGESNIEIILPFDVTSFSVDFGTEGGTNVTFALSENEDLVESITKTSTPDYFGTNETFSVDSTTPFDSVLITDKTDDVSINNLSYTPAAVTPEPGTLSLLGTGLLLLTGLTRRKLVAA